MAREATRVRARRAVTDSQKSERRREILAAAEQQLREVGFEDFSMEVLAKHLGFARGTLYRYFATREEVLLALYEAQRAAFCDALTQAVSPGTSDADFVEGYLNCATADPLFLSLSARLESVIEHNVSRDRLRESKFLMQDVLSRLGAHLAVCLELDPGAVRQVVISFGALLLGASELDAGPAFDASELPAGIRETLASMSRDDVFRDNAKLILEGVRRR